MVMLALAGVSPSLLKPILLFAETAWIVPEPRLLPLEAHTIPLLLVFK